MHFLLRGLAAACLGVPALVLAATPAHAIGATCGVSGGTLTVTLDEESPFGRLGQDGAGNVEVGVDPFDPEAAVPCLDEGNPIAVADLTSLVLADVFDDGVDWEIGTSPSFGAAVIHVEGDADTRIRLVGGPGADHWGMAPGPTLGLTLGGDAAPELTLATMPTGGTFDLGDGNDTLDLIGGPTNGPWSVPTTIDAGPGDDVVVGGTHRDVLHGGAGSDTLDSGLGDDTVYPEAGADTVELGSGDDELAASEQDGAVDDVEGGSLGNDKLIFQGSQHVVWDPQTPFADGAPGENDDYTQFEEVRGGQAGATVWAPDAGIVFLAEGTPNTLYSGPGNDTLGAFQFGSVMSWSRSPGPVLANGGMNEFEPDVIQGHGFDQTFGVHSYVGSPYGDDFFMPHDGVTIRPGLGDDSVYVDDDGTLVAEPVADGADTFGTSGTCTFDYTTRTTPVVVSSDGLADDGDPTAHGGAGEKDNVTCTRVVGGSASDTLAGGAHGDVLAGGPGNDLLVGRAADDQLMGGTGADTLAGNSGADILDGGDHNDRLYGGADEDDLDAGPGNDILDGGPGDDRELGQGGADTFAQGSTAADNGSDVLDGGSGIDTVSYLGRSASVTISNDGRFGDGVPGEGDNVRASIEKLVGGNAADVITGAGLADLLYGNGGADTIRGGGGNDTIDGGRQADKLYGDAGNDRFYAKDSTKDTVSGGTGTDKARRDAIDAVSSIEGTF